jgi:endonuclease/exonuclease/phosphatase family metal-dependent hydrolase
VSPAVFWPLAFFGLLHPAFVALNLAFLCWWIIRRRRQALYSLAMLMLSIPYFGSQLRLRFTTEPAPANAFTMMSYNVKLFDLYNWSGNAQTRAKIFTQLSAEKPDVLSLQEFFTEDTGDFRNLDSLRQLLKMPYAHYEYTVSLHKDDHWGVVTYSRFPIVGQGKIVFNNRNNNICIYSDLLIEKDTVRVYNMHLQSVSFGFADYKFMNKVKSGEDAEDELASSRNILRRMKRAYIKRARQAESIAEHISSCPYPVIVCGDFNDTPVSYTYRTISNGLEDAFCNGGKGFGKTFANPFPVPRIDYILHSPAMRSYEFRTLNEVQDLSDHYPVLAKISLGE